MKKIALFLALVVIGTAAFAAPAKTTAPAAATTTAVSSSPNAGLTAVSLNLIGCPSVRFGMGGWNLEVGGTIVNAANTTTLTLVGRGDIPLAKVTDNLSTYWGPGLMYNSAGNGTITISVLLGAEYMFAPKLALFADLTAFSLTSAGGTTTWFAGANTAQVYTGGRLYL